MLGALCFAAALCMPAAYTKVFVVYWRGLPHRGYIDPSALLQRTVPALVGTLALAGLVACGIGALKEYLAREHRG